MVYIYPYYKSLFVNIYFSSIYFSFLIFFVFCDNALPQIQNQIIKEIDGKYPKAKLLISGDYFVIFNKGIYIYNPDFSLKNIIYNFTIGDINIDDNCKIIISDYIKDNKYYILSLIKSKFIFIFDFYNNHYYKDNQLEQRGIKDVNDFDLIPYKLENDILYYIIIVLKHHNIEFYLCKMSNSQNIIEVKKTYNDNQIQGNYHISCNKMPLKNDMENEELICFYTLKQSGNYYAIKANILNISLNFTSINSFEYNTNIRNEIKDIRSLSIDGKKYLIFFCIDNKPYYLNYFTELNTFEIFVIKNEEFVSFGFFYFYETNQYIFIGYKPRELKLELFNENMTNIEINSDKKSITLSQCEDIKRISLVYSIITQQYILITDCKKPTGPPDNWNIIYILSQIEANYTNYSYYNPIDTLYESSQVSLKIDSTFVTPITTNFISDSIVSSSIISSNLLSSFISTDSLLSTTYIDLHTDIISSFNSSIPMPINIDTTSISEDKIINEFTEQKKDEIIKNITEIIKNIVIGNNYKITGDDFTLLIKPINSTYLDSSTQVIFNKCEEILRKNLNISESRILTFLQMEINNINEQSLVNQIEYQVYDDEKNQLDLSLCNDINIKILYTLKNNSLDFSSINSFKNLGIDIFNINDSFFNDICHPYSDLNNDMVLKDRIKYIYKNYSLCDIGCTYDDFNSSSMVISCDCNVKSNLSTNETDLNIQKLDDVKVDSNFAIIKCYNLVFSFNDKLNNIGFWIFLVLVFLHIPLLFHYFCKGIEPIKEYIINEMKKYGYLKNGTKNNKIYKKSSTKAVFKKSSKKTIHSHHNPPKYKKHHSKRNIILNENSEKGKINEINSNISKLNDNAHEEMIINKHRAKKKKYTPKSRKQSTDYYSKKSLKNVEALPTQGKDKNQINDKEKNLFNFCLININLNNIKEYKPQDSNMILNNYTYKEAIKYDMRPICVIFYIFLLSKQAVFHTFLYKSPLELFSLRFCLLIFIISSDLALNAFFYLDDKISEKYNNANNLFLFTFNNNLTIILLSTIIGFIFMTFFTNLSNLTRNIRDVFRKEEDKLKKDKKYHITENRKKEILEEIELVLKKYKIKIIIVIIIELLLMLFFFYYVTAFCHVYSSTQLSWLLDSFLSILSRFIIELLASFCFAKIYRMAIVGNSETIYKIVLFFYCFG